MIRVAIIGAGLSGSLMGVLLGKHGFDIDIFESRPDLRLTGGVGGRSINLALSFRGISALRAAGIDKEVLRDSIPMYSRAVHDHEGKVNLQRYGVDDTYYINSVSRGGLNISIINEVANLQNVNLFFNSRIAGIMQQMKVLVDDNNNGLREEGPYDLIIGADGAGSVLRGFLKNTTADFNEEISPLGYAYKELTIGPKEAKFSQMEANALHIWPRGDFMLIALPNFDESFTCTLFLPEMGDMGFTKLLTKVDVRAFFDEHFPDASALMPNLEEEYFRNQLGNLATLRCFPWVYENKALLIGDAAHAIVPFYGQGMNAAFEDCEVLYSLIMEYGIDLEKILPAYQEARKLNADAIAELALQNFIEMRDLTRVDAFQRKRILELALEQAFPEQYKSKYSMVTFSKMPYYKAKQIGDAQDNFLMSYCKDEANMKMPIDKLFNTIKDVI